MASVRKREWTHKGEAKTAWVVNYTDQEGRRRLKTFDLKKDADRYRLRVETEIEDGVHVAPSETATVSEVGEEYLSACDKRAAIRDRMTKVTVYDYRGVFHRHIAPRFGATKVSELNPLVVQTWLQDQRLTYSRGTVAKVRLVFGNLLDHAVRLRKAKRNVLTDHKVRTPQGEKKRVAVPSLAEIRRLLETMAERRPLERRLSYLQRRAIIPISLFCGLREGEIAALKWERIRFDLGLIEVRHSINKLDGFKEPKSKAGVRDVPIPPIVLDALLELHAFVGRPATGWAFPSASGKFRQPADVYREVWRPVIKRAGLEDAGGKPQFHFHALRHACVSLLIADGLSALHIKGFVGHSNIQTTLGTYGHLFPEDERVKASVVKVSALFDATPARQRIAGPEKRSESRVLQ